MIHYLPVSHPRRAKAMPGLLVLAAVMPITAMASANPVLLGTTVVPAALNALTSRLDVDPLVELVNATGLNDTGYASTTPTAFYRQNIAYGGNNLGDVTINKETTGKYGPAYANNLNGGVGYNRGTLTIGVSGYDNQFGGDETIILLGFQNIRYGNNSNGSLTTIETALTGAGVSWQDMNGLTNDWPNLSLAGQVDPLNGTAAYRTTADYDLELGLSGPYSTSGVSYFDFNFTGELGTAGNVVNIAAIPEPATMSLLLLGGAVLLLSRRPRTALV